MEFIAPSGNTYTIREQNGADDDIISNPVTAKDLSNMDLFIANIVIGPKLTKQLAAELPALDRMAILMVSRIFSIGQDFIFSYKWPDGEEEFYKQDLNDFLFDYSEEPSLEIIDSKPYAIPYYPDINLGMKDIEFHLSSGKKIKFDRLNGLSEKMAIALPEHQRTKNAELVIRNLHLEINGKWERVTSFHVFSVKDMQEMREFIFSIDPIYNGLCEITHEATGEKVEVPIVGMDNFFFQGVM